MPQQYTRDLAITAVICFIGENDTQCNEKMVPFVVPLRKMESDALSICLSYQTENRTSLWFVSSLNNKHQYKMLQ